jgi:hypothetical protein
MADGRKNNGAKKGVNQGAGRKPKATEIELIERLSPMEDEALKQLSKGVKSGDYKFIALYMAYRYGKPKESKDITTNGKDVNIPLIKWADDK